VLAPLITLIEGSSIDPVVVASVRSLIEPGEKVLVLLDSCHTKEHVWLSLSRTHRS
jgi:cephalosporin hydroxylase